MTYWDRPDAQAGLRAWREDRASLLEDRPTAMLRDEIEARRVAYRLVGARVAFTLTPWVDGRFKVEVAPERAPSLTEAVAWVRRQAA